MTTKLAWRSAAAVLTADVNANRSPRERFGELPWHRLGAAMNALYTRIETWRPFVLSILRIVIGLLFLQHGLSKVFNFPAPSPVPSLTGLLILAALLETVGAFLFLIGAYTRIVAFILSGEMAFAYFMAHAPRSFYPVVNAGELAVLFCFIFLYFAFAGGGPLSVDRAMLKQP
jgi:putative oxidoreductase